MDSQIVPYKLIPLKIFQDLQNSVKGEITNTSNNISQTTNNKNNSSRTIKEIQEHAISQMIKNSDGDKEKNNVNLEIPSVQQQLADNIKTYADGISKKEVMWVHQDDETLPQFSKQSKIENSLENYLKILNSKDISDDLKVKLATIYKQKYDRSRHHDLYKDSEYDADDEDDSDVIIGNSQNTHYTGQEVAIALALAKSTVTKMPLLKKLADELMKHTKYINWNHKGVLTHPQRYRYTPHLNLTTMLDIMINKRNKATPTEMGIILNIIRPFYREIKPHLKNEKIINQIDEWNTYNRKTASMRTAKNNRSLGYQSL